MRSAASCKIYSPTLSIFRALILALSLISKDLGFRKVRGGRAKGGAEILLGILQDLVCIGGSGIRHSKSTCQHVNDVTVYARKQKCNASVRVHVSSCKARRSTAAMHELYHVMYMYVSPTAYSSRYGRGLPRIPHARFADANALLL
jgi:hypothetical protein